MGIAVVTGNPKPASRTLEAATLVAERIAGEPTLVLQGRLSLRPWEKGLVLARSLARVGA